MPRMLTTLDVLSDVEFELAQSVISRDELGQSLQAVRQFQVKFRTDLFDARQAALDQRQIINRLLQIQEMQTTLLQEMAAAIQAVQLDVRRTGQLRPREVASNSPAPTAPSVMTTPSAVLLPPTDWPEDALTPIWPTEPIENAMRSDTLKLKADVRPSTIPLLGGLWQRVRAAFHSLTLFYLQQLGQRQTGVNQIYGERLLQVTDLIQQQQQQIDALRAQLAALSGSAQDS